MSASESPSPSPSVSESISPSISPSVSASASPSAATVEERVDFRAQFPKRPVARISLGLTVSANSWFGYGTFDFNALVNQIVADIPNIGAATVTIRLLDEEDTILFEKAGVTSNGRTTIPITTTIGATTFPWAVALVGTTTIQIELSAPQGTDKDYTIILFGT